MSTAIDKPRKMIVLLIYLASITLFIFAVQKPIMGTEILMGLKSSEVYLTDSIEYFFENGDWFLGTIILLFTFILPILKYLFVGTQVFRIPLPRGQWVHNILEVINKWAMLDVFIVALLIMTFKFETTIMSNYVMIGTNLFAASIILLMISSYLLKKGRAPTRPMSANVH